MKAAKGSAIKGEKGAKGDIGDDEEDGGDGGDKKFSLAAERKKWIPSSSFSGERGQAAKGAMAASDMPSGMPNCFEVFI